MTPEQIEKARKAFIKGCKSVHPNRKEVLVPASQIIAILGIDTVYEHNLFKFVMRTQEEPPPDRRSSTDTLRRMNMTKQVGLCGVDPHVLLPLLEAAGKLPTLPLPVRLPDETPGSDDF